MSTAAPTPTEAAIHEALRQRLATAGCVRGRLAISAPGAHLSLSGQKPDGKTIFFWEFDRPFQRLVGQYLTKLPTSQVAQFTIEVDVVNEVFHHAHTTNQQVAAAKEADEKHALELRRRAPRDRTPYGRALAERVANRLDQGATLAYSHRDYCGQGLSRRGAAEYLYGSVWEGDLQPDQVFPGRAAFVAWLAAQSDYALSGVAHDDPWSWDNQTITRQRLEEFAR